MGTSRREVREKLEQHLDKMQPASERERTWGRQMTQAQWRALKKRKKKGSDGSDDEG